MGIWQMAPNHNLNRFETFNGVLVVVSRQNPTTQSCKRSFREKLTAE